MGSDVGNIRHRNHVGPHAVHSHTGRLAGLIPGLHKPVVFQQLASPLRPGRLGRVCPPA
jgi:hypothetical protein